MKKLVFKFFVGLLIIGSIFGVQFSNDDLSETAFAMNIGQVVTSTATIAIPVAPAATATAPAAAPVLPGTTATATPTKVTSIACNTDDTSCLEGIYNGLTKLIKEQEKRLEDAYKSGRDAQSLVDKLNEEGRDSSALREALDNFLYLVNDAQSSHDRAKEIIHEHVGFDNKGKVVNRDQAKVTVEDGKEFWLSASQTISQANKELRGAVAKAKRKPTSTKAPITVDE